MKNSIKEYIKHLEKKKFDLYFVDLEKIRKEGNWFAPSVISFREGQENALKLKEREKVYDELIEELKEGLEDED